MRGKRFLLLLSVILCIVTVSAVSKLNRQEVPADNKKQVSTEAEIEQGPIADYLAPEPSDPSELARRKSRGKKYEELAGVPINPVASGIISTLNIHWDLNLLPLPVDQSNLIVIGTVSDAKAFLTPNKVTVYSEFTVNIEKVFKNDPTKPFAPDQQITLERQGGRVRIPSGGIQRYVVAGQGFPRIGRRYLFFLSQNESEDNYFYILTAYELRDGQVFPLDDVRQFKTYKGTEETSFLNEIQKAVTPN